MNVTIFKSHSSMFWYCQKGCSAFPLSQPFILPALSVMRQYKELDQTTDQPKSTQKKRNWFPPVNSQVWLTSLGLVLAKWKGKGRTRRADHPFPSHNRFMLDWLDSKTIEEEAYTCTLFSVLCYFKARSSFHWSLCLLCPLNFGWSSCQFLKFIIWAHGGSFGCVNFIRLPFR